MGFWILEKNIYTYMLLHIYIYIHREKKYIYIFTHTHVTIYTLLNLSNIFTHTCTRYDIHVTEPSKICVILVFKTIKYFTQKRNYLVSVDKSTKK